MRPLQNSLSCYICAISATPSSVLLSVSRYIGTPSSSVLGSHEMAQIRYEEEFCNGLFVLKPALPPFTPEGRWRVELLFCPKVRASAEVHQEKVGRVKVPASHATQSNYPTK